MKIQTPTLTLRNWKDSDAEELALIANNKKIFDNLRDLFPYPYALRDAEAFIGMANQQGKKSILLAVEIDGKVAGSTGIMFKEDIYRKNAEIGYFLGEKYWGKGHMTEAIRVLTAYIFQNFDIIRIYAEPFADNIGSRKALEKAGYKCEALLKNFVIKNNVVKDSCVYSILKEEFT